MNSQFALTASLIALAVLTHVIYTLIQNSIRRAFLTTLEHQRRDFTRSLTEVAARASGPTTGEVGTVKPPTGPTKPPTGGRTVRKPTTLN